MATMAPYTMATTESAATYGMKCTAASGKNGRQKRSMP